MRSCTSTNLHEGWENYPRWFSLEESLRACTDAGFECMDLNLHSATDQNGPLSEDAGWGKWVDHVRTFRDENGIDTPYAHSYFYLYPDRDDRQEALTCRSIEAAGRLGVKWIVVHPYSVCDDAWYSHKKSLEDNLHYMDRYAEIAARYHMGIALENMVEDVKKRRFSSSAEDLLELLERLDNSSFGICWDFGHGERSGCDMVASLRMIGSHLKAVHVHDYTRNQFGFDHTIPFLGITDWATIMPVLREIGYTGDWDFECHNFTRRLPPEMRKTALCLALQVCKKMIAMAEEDA